MNDSPRKATSFRISPEKPAEAKKTAEATPRKPRATKPTVVEFREDHQEAFAVAAQPDRDEKPVRFWTLGTVLFSALTALGSIGIGVWADAMIRELLVRWPTLGMIALALSAIALLAALALAVREIAGVMRLSARHALRKQVLDAWTSQDRARARHAAREIEKAVDGLPATAEGRARYAAIDREFLDAREVLSLAETELLAALDRQARQAVRESAHRVSVVTAISPRALVDVAYVIYESFRLIRRIATIYNARPGTLGMWRLARRVVEHLAVTGTVAIGDSLLQQVLGHGVAARISARLGEGVVNGLMTARIGISAMDVTRPAPFLSAKAPTPALFLPDLSGSDKTDPPKETA